jgi:hypothetical protein
MNWSEVISQPVFAELSPAGQAEARRRWVDEVYLPEVAKAGVSEEGQQRVRHEALTEFDNGQGGVSSFFNAAGRGLAGTASGVVGGIGAVTGNEGWRETADAMDAAVANALPVNLSLPKTNFVGSALGQAGGVMLTAGAGGALAKGLAGVRAVAAGTEMAAMGSGVLSGARQGADDADEYGMTGLDYAARVALGGVTEYITEKLPFGLSAETGAARKLLGAGGKTPSRALTFGGGVVTESLEEGASQIAQNAANMGLAPVGTDTPTLFTGVAGSMAGGAIGGAGFGGVNLLTGANAGAPAAAPFNGLPLPAGFAQSQVSDNSSQIVSNPKKEAPSIPIGKLSLNGQAFVYDGAGWQRPATMEELAAEPGMLLRPLDADDVAEGATIAALDAAAQAAIRRKAGKLLVEKDSGLDVGRAATDESGAVPSEGVPLTGGTELDPQGDAMLPPSPGMTEADVPAPRNPLTADAVKVRLQGRGITGAGLMVVSDPALPWEGRLKADGTIELNAARLTNEADVDRVIEHEAAHMAERDPEMARDIEEMVRAVPAEFVESLKQDLVSRGYRSGAIPSEVVANIAEQLGSRFQQQGTWTKLVRRVKTWAKQRLGMELNQQDAEALAARVVARGMKMVKDAAVNEEDRDRYSLAAAHESLKASTAPSINVRTKELKKVPVTTKSHLVEGIYRNLDAIFKELGSPLESAKKWATFTHAITGSLGKPGPHLMAPSRAMQYVRGEGLEFITKDLVKHPEFVEAREGGLALATRMLGKFRSGELGRADLAGLFAWGLLSRGVGAYYQEGAYLALHREGLLDRIEQVFAGAMTPQQLTEWGLAHLANSPGMSSSHNVMALGNQMEALMTPIDGRPAIDLLLDDWKSGMTGPELRRRVFAIFTDDRPSIQIQNKVLSFIILVSGRPDVLVLDRIQFRHLWGGEEADEAVAALAKQVAKAKKLTIKTYGKGSPEAALAEAVSSDPDNIYDSLPVIAQDGTFKFRTGKGKLLVETNGIFKAGNGLHGMSLYEALERALHEPVRRAYVDNGISFPGIGAFHWDSWLVTSQQAISHPTLALIARENESPAVGVQQGKFNQIDYGVVYRRDGQYSRELLTSPGEHVIFSSKQAKEFYTAAALRKALKSKITLSTDETGADRNRPWTDDLTPEQRAKFDEYLLSFAERVAPTGTTGDAAWANDGGSGTGSLDVRHGAIGRRIGGTVAYKPRDSEGPGRSPGNDQDGVRRGLKADEFVAAGQKNRASHKFGTSVDVYSAGDYAGYDLILIEREGETATASISPDGEIGAVTKSAGADAAMVDAAFEAAIATGKVKWLNGFDTILPSLYAAKGFAPVARLKFAEEQKPAGWDFEAYGKFDNGRPDVVFMRHTGTPVEYRPGDGPLADSWDAAVAAATRLKSPGADQFSLPARNGRAQPVDTDVMSPQGPVAIGALRVGDLITAPDGGTQRVSGTFPQGVRAVFQIRLEDGRMAPATADHLWLARRENGEAVVVTTARLSEGLVLGEEWSLPVAAEN